MNKNLNPQTVGFLLAVFGTALFSLKSIFIKFLYAEGLNTDSVITLRMAISLPIYLGIFFWLQFNSTDRRYRNHLPMIAFLGFIGYFLSSWLDLKGLEMISAQLERLTLFTYPIMVAFLGALFFKTPLTRGLIWSLVLTYSGLMLVFVEELNFSGEETFLGTTMVFLAALSFSFYVLFGKQVISKVGSQVFTSLAMSISSLFVLLYFSLFHDFDQLEVSAVAWFWLVMLAVFSTVVPSYMIAEAIHRIGPAHTGIIGSLGPVMTMGMAVWLLHEPFTPYHLAGLLLVLLGVGMLTRSKG
ncbi:DMT family transporter [Thiomicrorhabdus sp.]|uniref:DMT family transporter n=1 Tax=Thiomicrorhabdus sp. TaxID=2039724 RepID=UPI0029C67609|nr:DMT family transporter [Thiomicrorhabdus sp.]